MSVCINVYADATIEPYFNLCLPFFKKWTINMNYDFNRFYKNTFDCHPAWLKIYYLIKTLNTKKYDIVCSFDADIIINNSNIDIYSFLKPDKDIYICKNGGNGGDLLNSGVILTKYSDRSINFLNKVWSEHDKEYKNKQFWEQEIINQLYGKYHYMIEVLENRALNSYGDDNLDSQPYNNVYHFMGKPLQEKVKFVENYILKLSSKGSVL
jgi:hypothetical protein